MIPLININRLRHAKSKYWITFSTRHAKRLVLIYSKEWWSYWRPNSGGYTKCACSAGVYSFEEALNASGHCGPEKQICYEFLQ